MALELFKFSPLPNPPTEYDPQYFRQFLRTLEIYFAQLDALTPNQAKSYRADNFYGDGTGIVTPKAQFTSSTSQTAASTTTAYAVSLTDTLYADRVSLVSSSRITFATAGAYNIEYELQVENPSSTKPEDVRVWLRKNGTTNIPLSAKTFGVAAHKGGGVESYAVASAKVMVTVAALDYVEIMWATTDIVVNLPAIAATTSPAVPTTPSAVVSVDFAVAV